MAKLATQTVVIQISKAVADSANDEINALDEEAIAQLKEAIVSTVGLIPTDDEIGRFLLACEQCRDDAPYLPEFVKLILDTGMRAMELLEMKRGNVRLDDKKSFVYSRLHPYCSPDESP